MLLDVMVEDEDSQADTGRMSHSELQLACRSVSWLLLLRSTIILFSSEFSDEHVEQRLTEPSLHVKYISLCMLCLRLQYSSEQLVTILGQVSYDWRLTLSFLGGDPSVPLFSCACSDCVHSEQLQV